MSVFEINKYLARPLKFYEFQYVENHINNPRHLNKDYFEILYHLKSKLFDLSLSDLERLTRMVILGEVADSCSGELEEMALDEPASLKAHVVSNIPRYPVFVNDNLKKVVQRNDMDIAGTEMFFALDRSVILQALDKGFNYNFADTVLKIDSLKI